VLTPPCHSRRSAPDTPAPECVRKQVALVVATLDLGSGAISQSVSGASVIIVVATTVVTPPLLRATLRRAPEVDSLAAVGTPPTSLQGDADSRGFTMLRGSDPRDPNWAVLTINRAQRT